MIVVILWLWVMISCMAMFPFLMDDKNMTTLSKVLFLPAFLIWWTLDWLYEHRNVFTKLFIKDKE